MSDYRRRGAHYRPTVEVAQQERHVRTPGSLSVFAAFACTALVAVSLASPHVPSQADVLAPTAHLDGQKFAIDIDTVDAVTRDGFKVTKIVTAKPPPAAGIPDPGTAQAIAYEMVTARGWDSNEFDCLVALWNRESHWNVYSLNTSSGAYGIPQALPGDKMASVAAEQSIASQASAVATQPAPSAPAMPMRGGAALTMADMAGGITVDSWLGVKPATQITWGLGYITARYGTPCGAWNHSQAKGWY